MIKFALLAACGGAIGAVGRYLVGVGAARAFGINFPWGTLIVNVLGSFAMGILIGFLALRLTGSESLRIFLAVGVLGGFTTFSAFSMDVVYLIERKALGTSFLYAGSSVVFSVVAMFLGLYLARQGLR